MTTDLASLLDVAEAIAKERLARLGIAEKGDAPGHPFRGNQWTGGKRRSGIEGESAGALSAEDKTHRMGVAKDAAKEFGFDPNDVVAGGAGYTFTAGNLHAEAAAEFNPATGKITIYDGALAEAGTDELYIKSLVAHEVNHAKYLEVHSKYDSEKTSLLFNKNKLDYDGELLPKYRKEYPTYHALHKYLDGDKTDILQKEDGVTDYSKAYWSGKKKKSGKLSIAIDETLAEISYLGVQGGGENVSGTWRELHSAVDSHYNRLKKSRK